jgi:hypothetical protein
MAIQPLNIAMGPATVFYAPFGSTEPAYTAITSPPSSTTWTDVGATADGTSVLLEVEHSLTEIHAEQLIDPIGARVTKRVIQITAHLTEATLINLQLAMNQLLTISPGTGYTVADPLTSITAVQPTYMALIIDGWAPTTGTTEAECRRRIIVRKCLSSSKADLEYEKTKPTVYQTTWTGFWVSSSVAPFEIIDQTS